MKGRLPSIPIFAFFVCSSLGFAQDPNPHEAAPPKTESPEAAGDSASHILASRAWESLAEGDYPAARSQIERCRKLYEAKAKEMQASLTSLPGPENAASYWALNDVGTCIFIAGKVAEGEGKRDEAVARYQEVVDQFSMAQCWDKQGWYWQPAVAAKERLAALTLDSKE